MKYRIYITQTWTHSDIIEASSVDEAYEIAGNISCDIDPKDMCYGDDYIEVEEVR